MRFQFDYDPETGIAKYLNWDNHNSENDKIVIEQSQSVKNAIYEENKRRFNEGVNTKESLGLMGTIPYEDYYEIVKNYPEFRTLKGEDRTHFWKVFFSEIENRKFLANKKLLNTGGSRV